MRKGTKLYMHDMIYLLVISVPESFLMVLIGANLLNITKETDIASVFIFAFIFSVLIYLFRLTSIPFQLEMLLKLALFILLTVLILKISYLESLYFSVTTYTIVTITELVFIFLVEFFVGDISTLIHNFYNKLSIALMHILFLYLAYLFIRKKKIRFFQKLITSNKVFPVALLIIAFIQIFLFINFFNEIIFYDKAEHFMYGGIPIYILLILVCYVLSFIILKKWFEEETKREIKQTESIYQEHVDELIISMKSKHHDINNHLNVLYSLVESEEYPEVKKYLKELVKETSNINESLKISNRTLGALIFSKSQKAFASDIDFQIYIQPSFNEFVKIMPTDLIKLLSNLIDNAFENALKIPSKSERKVFLNLDSKLNICRIQIKNTGEAIKNFEKACEIGFSSKGKNRGYGLAIVKQVVNKYQGILSYN